jgi:DNA-binding beta-propeller fold protein YncE
MLKRSMVLLASLAIPAAAVALAASGRTRQQAAGGKRGADYKLVAGWPRLPEQIKLGEVTAVATDTADHVYLFHRGKNPIIVLDRAGNYLRSWGDDLVKNAHGLRLDREGNVWITDLGHHLVMKFEPRGKLLLTLGTRGKSGAKRDTFNKPADVAFGPAGEVYVADGYGNARVVKFSKEGKYLRAWGQKGKGEGEFNLPHAIRVDAKGRVYVGDRENNRIQVFDPDGRFLAQWKDTGAPFGLFLTPQGRMLLADGRAHLARVLDLDGKTLGRWGQQGTDPGQFALPHGICMDSRGAVYVTEIKGHRIQKFAKP